MKNPEVKVAIIRSGKKVYEIAMELGWDRAKLSSIISGCYTPNSAEKRQLAQVLGRSIHELRQLAQVLGRSIHELFTKRAMEGIYV